METRRSNTMEEIGREAQSEQPSKVWGTLFIETRCKELTLQGALLSAGAF